MESAKKSWFVHLPQEVLYSDKTSCWHSMTSQYVFRAESSKTDWRHMMSARDLWSVQNDPLWQFAGKSNDSNIWSESSPFQGC